MSTVLDPVDYAVISQAFMSIAREAGVKLIRSACSTIVREARDCAAALLDRDGNVVAQSELIPIQLGSMGPTAQSCLALYPPDTLCPGDFLINNDPYNGGQHLQDVFIYAPIFFAAEVIGFSGSVAHHIDLGGAKAGIATSASDLYQEGLVFPPMRYNFERDWNGGAFERFVRSNIRVPVQTIGDLNAQFAACHVAQARVLELASKFGGDTVTASMAELLDYSERRVRLGIAELPNGVYHGEDAVDDDGIGDEPLRVQASVTISDESIAVDFAGTCDQVLRNINAPFASTVSATLCCIKPVLTGADIPFNSGASRPISVSAPLGCLLNPRHPAPVRARMEPSYRAFGAVMRALSCAAPERVIAAGFDSTFASAISRRQESGFSVLLEIIGGGFGASPTGDGCDTVAGPLGNCANTPIEVIDMEFDYLRPLEYSVLPDSAGGGEFRGGLGQRRAYEVLSDGVTFSMYVDRMRIAPQGLNGGADGRRARVYIRRGDNVIELESKVSVGLHKGDILVLESGGGAGFGSPSLRSPSAVERDVDDGLLSPLGASELYNYSELT
jgi:N-methylhydantoinase B